LLARVVTPVRPLGDDLALVVDKSRWGYRFRAGVFQIDEHDFGVIRSAMTDGNGGRVPTPAG
jgi:hypothetical protein